MKEKYKFVIQGKTSPLFSYLQKYVQNSYQDLAQNKISPWSNLHLGKPLKVQNYYGKKIHYEGIKFEGSPKIVFWENYIEPFLENIIIDAVRKTTSLCNECKIKNSLPFNDLRKLLKISVKNVYSIMNKICSINNNALDIKILRLNNIIDKTIANTIKLIPGVKWYQSRTIQAAMIGGVIALIVALIGNRDKSITNKENITIGSEHQSGGVTAERVIINNISSSETYPTDEALQDSIIKLESRNKLRVFYGELKVLSDYPIPTNNRGALLDYKQKINKWVSETSQWIEINIGFAAREVFLNRHLGGRILTSDIDNRLKELLADLLGYEQGLQKLIKSDDMWNENINTIIPIK